MSVISHPRPRTVLAFALLSVACGDATGPREEPLPPVVFVAVAEGYQHLFRLDAGTPARLTSEPAHHRSPSVALSGIAFSIDRAGNQDVFYAVPDSAPRRITTHPAGDDEPSLHPAGNAIVFVSYRSGAPRLWLTDTLGTDPVALNTGSQSFTPERGPRWSPDGEWIAFTSARTGTSQVWLVPAAGGDAIQLSRESAGAFDAAWSPDGNRVIYVTPSPHPRLRSVARDGTDARDFATAAEGLGQPACAAEGCVAVLRPYIPGEGVLVRIGSNGAIRPVAGAPAGISQPAMAR